ncbi:MAG: acyltransferase family protein, partial [Chitinophagaceae bacterium]|nr:acyltransferase family protein [Chitinophagaceae bacterium]
TGVSFFIVAFLTYVFQDTLPELIRNNWLTESFIESLLCVGISMGILTFFRFYGNKSNKFLTVLSENSFGIYLFHVFVVIGLQVVLLPININVNVKFALVSTGGVLISVLISYFLRKISFIKAVI